LSDIIPPPHQVSSLSTLFQADIEYKTLRSTVCLTTLSTARCQPDNASRQGQTRRRLACQTSSNTCLLSNSRSSNQGRPISSAAWPKITCPFPSSLVAKKIINTFTCPTLKICRNVYKMPCAPSFPSSSRLYILPLTHCPCINIHSVLYATCTRPTTFTRNPQLMA
jgi:hypothetical protein